LHTQLHCIIQRMQIHRFSRYVSNFSRRLPSSLLASSLFAITLTSAPLQAFAQAGSRPATLFDSATAFYNSLAATGQPGMAEPMPMVPDGVLMLSNATDYLMWVELELGRLNLLERMPDGGLIVRKRIPVSIGKQGIGKVKEGDRKTPIGTYHIMSYLADERIDDFYGTGAYPLNYPNALDRRLKRTGHGIWLHGLPKDVTERPFLDSDGCVVIDNANLDELAGIVSTGVTQVVLSQEPIKWVATAALEETRAGLEAALQAWVAAWEARDNAAYLAFYADDFSDLARNKVAWSTYKSRVNSSKRFIDIELSDISMLVDPVQRDLVTVRYRQSYKSDNYNWRGWKEQLWRQDGTRWEIIYEGNG
jgi:murein L,D-transpeptidase YafK